MVDFVRLGVMIEESMNHTMPCGDCGDAEGRNGWDGSCRNHREFVLCRACGHVYPLMKGTFDPGHPARGPSYSSGGEPGEPPQVYCPNDECPEAEEASDPVLVSDIVAQLADVAPTIAHDVAEAFKAWLTQDGSGGPKEGALIESLRQAGFDVRMVWSEFQVKVVTTKQQPSLEDRIQACADCGSVYDPKVVDERLPRPPGRFGAMCGACRLQGHKLGA